MSGDDITADFSAAAAAFADEEVGVGKTVTATGVVIGGVDATNYAVTGPVQGTADILPVPTAVFIDDDYTSESSVGNTFGYNSFTTIQAGINAVADGGTVNVAAGTYDEQLDVNKDITITGTGIGQTIVQPTNVPDTGAGHGSAADVYP